jgi:hypothetical protein
LCRDISNFKKGYQPKTNIGKNGKGDSGYRLAQYCAPLGGGAISLSCSLCMGLVMLGRQKYVEPLVPDLSAFQVEMAIEKLKRRNSPGRID